MTDGVTVTGLDDVIRNLNRLPKDVQKYGKTARDKALVALHASAVRYPRKPPRSKYRRTDTLGRKWDIKPDSGFGGRIENPTKYAPYVQGTPGIDRPAQAWMHVERWATTAQIAREQQQKIIGFYEYAVSQAVKANG